MKIDEETGEILENEENGSGVEVSLDVSGMTLGQKLDAAFGLKFQIEELERRAKELKADYDVVKIEILNEMQEKDLDKIECSYGSATFKSEPFPNIRDHMAFFEWVADTRRFEFLEKRCSRSAVKDMLTNEGSLPTGIDVFMKADIVIRKKPVRRAK